MGSIKFILSTETLLHGPPNNFFFFENALPTNEEYEMEYKDTKENYLRDTMMTTYV